jgi:GNAT superfamily N-acetyltransferase
MGVIFEARRTAVGSSFNEAPGALMVLDPTSKTDIRRTEPRDADSLPAVERSAGQAFRQVPELAWLAEADDRSVEWHRRLIGLGTSWVAVDHDDHPIGFLAAEAFADALHIWEVAVHQQRQRAGLGRRLIERAIAEARSRDLAAVTLTTFRDLRWNEQFYARLGFKTLDAEQIGPRLAEALRADMQLVLPRDWRCAMRFDIK